MLTESIGIIGASISNARSFSKLKVLNKQLKKERRKALRQKKDD